METTDAEIEIHTSTRPGRRPLVVSATKKRPQLHDSAVDKKRSEFEALKDAKKLLLCL